MAGLYTKDITNSINPAAADVGTLGKGIQAKAEGARLSANATGIMLKAAGFLAEQYVAYDVGQSMVETEGGMTEQKFATKGKTAEGLTQEMLDRGMAAEKAAQDLPLVTAERNKLASMGTSYSVVPDAETRRQAAIGRYDEEIKRLKDASAGGMSNEEYVSRVSALTRKAIAKYPGLADSIREKVGTITGLPYADRWAEMQYVRERFTKEAKKDSEFDPMKLVMKDIERASNNGFGTQETLLLLKQKNDPMYDVIMKKSQELDTLASSTKAIENNIKAQTSRSDETADKDKAQFPALFNGAVAGYIAKTAVTDLETTYREHITQIGLGLTGKTLDPVALDTRIQLHNVKMKTAIASAKQGAMTKLEEYFAQNPFISDAKRNAMREDILKTEQNALSQYADDKGVGLLALSTVLVKYRDRGLKEQRDLFTAIRENLIATQASPLSKMYWSNDPAMRERLKTENPNYYKWMEEQEKGIFESMANIKSITEDARELDKVAVITETSKTSPAAIIVNPETNPLTTKAAIENVNSLANESLDKAVDGKTLSSSEKINLSAAMSTNMETGANYQTLADSYKKTGDKIRLLPEDSVATIKDNVSKASITNVNTMSALKRGMETKHGIKLNLGVTPSGQIVAMPTPLSKEEQARQKALGITKIPMDDPRRKEPAAIDDFNKQSRAMLSNLVFGRAMLTEENPVAVANEFADMLNKGQPYNGFYSNAAVAPPAVAAPVESPSVVPASELGSQQFPMTPAPAAPATTSDFTGAAPIPASALANQEAMRLAEEKANAAKPAAPAVAAPVTSNAPKLTSQREASGKLIDESKRPDGTTKGNGYLGVLKASDGSDVTEFTTSTSDFKVKGKEVLFPIIVPTLTKEELKLLLTDIIPNKKTNIPDAIYKKAIDHAKKRIKQGKSVFAETGDYKPADIIAPKKNPLSGQRPDLQPDAASATSNAPSNTSTTKKWWQ